MNSSFESAVVPPENLNQQGYWFIFHKFDLLVHDEAERARIPRIGDPRDLGLDPVRSHYLGSRIEGESVTGCYAAEVVEPVATPSGMQFRGLRSLFTHLTDTELALAGRAVQIIDWDRTHQYCGRCGASVEQLAHERAKRCPECATISYPRISPAVIVSVERSTDDGLELLLARNHRFPSGYFSVLAGFVEPGESLESCAKREVREEVGVEIDELHYFGSQSWPFPNSLMIAFTARYAGGQIRLEEEEIAEAAWFKANALPKVPPPVSIARQLIDAFVQRSQTDINLAHEDT